MLLDIRLFAFPDLASNTQGALLSKPHKTRRFGSVDLAGATGRVR